MTDMVWGDGVDLWNLLDLDDQFQNGVPIRALNRGHARRVHKHADSASIGFAQGSIRG